jgi:hypothetical protein
MIYKLFIGIDNTKRIIRLSDNAFIPFDPMNSDYVEYLRWLAEGGVPLPPDSQE